MSFPETTDDVILRGRIVTLRPLTQHDAAALYEAGRYPEVWTWGLNQMRSLADMERYVQTALAERAAGISIPFATTDSETNEVVGSTRFGNISEANKRVEIGWTWLTPARQRTGANTEAKLLQLTYAFETLGCIRVELKTDVLNEQSRNAMLRIGAKEEGVFRHHLITESGRLRDTIYFSILAKEWPAVKTFLQSPRSTRTDH